MRRRPLTRFAAIAVASLTATGGALLVAGPASAAPGDIIKVTDADIAPDASTYAGWHEGYDNATPAYSTHWDGLRFGTAESSSQIINGLAEPQAVTADALAELITGAELQVKTGLVSLQVPIFFGGSEDPVVAQSFTTLRPADLAGPGVTGFATTDSFISSRALGDIPGGTPAPLSEIITELEEAGNVDLLAFGALAVAGNPSTLETLTWNEEVFDFRGLEVTVPGVATIVEVLPEDLVPLEELSGELGAGWGVFSGFLGEDTGELPEISEDDELVFTPGGGAIYLDDTEVEVTGRELGRLLTSSYVDLTAGAALAGFLVTAPGDQLLQAFVTTVVDSETGSLTYETIDFAAGAELGDLVYENRDETFVLSGIILASTEETAVNAVRLGDQEFVFVAEPTVVTPPVVDPEVPVEETPGETPVVDEGGENTAPVAANRPTALSNTGSDATVPAVLGGALLLLGGLLLGARTLRRRGTES